MDGQTTAGMIENVENIVYAIHVLLQQPQNTKKCQEKVLQLLEAIGKLSKKSKHEKEKTHDIILSLKRDLATAKRKQNALQREVSFLRGSETCGQHVAAKKLKKSSDESTLSQNDTASDEELFTYSQSMAAVEDNEIASSEEKPENDPNDSEDKESQPDQEKDNKE